MPTKTASHIFHLLPNAHLDPVWLWDWREGLNEGIKTVHAMLDLMDEFPQLTFIRGESAIYQHIEKTDPALFHRLERMIRAGRWDVVGGTVIQPDSDLPSTETLCRHFEQGLSYFESRFGKRPTVSWQADTFGHTPGWPNILSSFGMKGFAFTRPQQSEFPLKSPLFWWEGDHQNRILCYRQPWLWYCSERANLPEMLDKTLADTKINPYKHLGVLMGLGDHGGGTSRRHILDVEKWQQQHPEVEVRFSTLHGFFEELKKEEAKIKIPVVRGDLGYCLRGCYSSVQKFKTLYRKAESILVDAEATHALLAPPIKPFVAPLQESWDSVLFNSFHDILPGTSIERAFEEEIAWVNMAIHHARDTRFAALNTLASQVDTSVPPARKLDAPIDVPFLVWNIHPHPFKGLVELEGSIDYRPIWEYQHKVDQVPVVVFDHKGKPLPFQEIATEHTAMTDLPWRKRVLVPLEIPAFGWTVVRMGYRDKVEKKVSLGSCQAQTKKNHSITNGDWKVEVKNGEAKVLRHNQNFFLGSKSLQFQVVDDPWGSWGGLYEEKGSSTLNALREKWKLVDHSVLESGPLRAKLWTRWQGKNSWIDLTFSTSHDDPKLKVSGRLLWNERSARLKLILPSQGDVEFDVPGSQIHRDAIGLLPAGHWVRRTQGKKTLGFASDGLSCVDFTKNELCITLARASRYANDVQTGPDEKLWQPAVDCGELKFQFCLFGNDTSADTVAQHLLTPPNVLLPLAHPGDLPSQGSMGSILPTTVRLLSLKKLPSGKTQVRVQNRDKKSANVVFQLKGKKHALGKLGSQQIATYTIS